MNQQQLVSGAETTAELKKMAFVRLTAFGGYYAVGRHTHDFNSWNAADEFLKEVARRNEQDDFPWGGRTSKDEGIQVGVRVTFGDGRTFTGNYKVGGAANGDANNINLTAWLRQGWNLFACRSEGRPGHYSDADWQQHLDDVMNDPARCAKKRQYAQYLERYDLSSN